MEVTIIHAVPLIRRCIYYEEASERAVAHRSVETPLLIARTKPGKDKINNFFDPN